MVQKLQLCMPMSSFCPLAMILEDFLILLSNLTDFFVIMAREEGSPNLTPQSRALLISLRGAAAEMGKSGIEKCLCWMEFRVIGEPF